MRLERRVADRNTLRKVVWAQGGLALDGAHGLKPHLISSFKVSNDPEFAEKAADAIGFYPNPPDKALVLSVDEKSQIQALDRSQSGLPTKPGRAGTMTHDYKRHGTTTLFAGHGRARRHGHRPVHEAAQAPGVHPFLEPDRPPNPARAKQALETVRAGTKC